MYENQSKLVLFSTTKGIVGAAALFAVIIVLLVLNGCGDSDEASAATVSCTGVEVSYITDVYPIIEANCATKSTCHGSGSNNGPGPLLTYSQVAVARSAIKSSVASGEMPKDGRLSTDEKNTILCWIENGASNN